MLLYALRETDRQTDRDKERDRERQHNRPWFCFFWPKEGMDFSCQVPYTIRMEWLVHQSPSALARSSEEALQFVSRRKFQGEQSIIISLPCCSKLMRGVICIIMMCHWLCVLLFHFDRVFGARAGPPTLPIWARTKVHHIQISVQVMLPGPSHKHEILDNLEWKFRQMSPPRRIIVTRKSNPIMPLSLFALLKSLVWFCIFTGPNLVSCYLEIDLQALGFFFPLNFVMLATLLIIHKNYLAIGSRRKVEKFKSLTIP